MVKAAESALALVFEQIPKQPTSLSKQNQLLEQHTEFLLGWSLLFSRHK
jgi:hypothetical protein